MQKDWIDQVNELAEAKGWDDRAIVEYMVMWISLQREGGAFLVWLKLREELDQ